jgi:hypothetical protein
MPVCPEIKSEHLAKPRSSLAPQPSIPHPHRRKAATTLDGETPRLCPSQDLKRQSLARFARRWNSTAPPAPIVPNGDCSGAQAFRSLTCQELSFVAPCAAGPLRATPASASLLRDLLTAIAPSKRFLSFAFVSLFARDLAPSKQPQKVQYRKSDVLERTGSNTDYDCY